MEHSLDCRDVECPACTEVWKLLRRVNEHMAALVPVFHNACPRRVRERHHAILAELSRLLP